MADARWLLADVSISGIPWHGVLRHQQVLGLSFGCEMVSCSEFAGRDDIGTGTLGALCNIV